MSLIIYNARLVTLAGSGGSGKTRLAIEAGRSARATNPGGVFFAAILVGCPAPKTSKGAASETAGASPMAMRQSPSCQHRSPAKNADVWPTFSVVDSGAQPRW